MHKENVSALMDGELLDDAILGHLVQDKSLQQTWERYHLVRDVMRDDTGNTLHFDISVRVMAAIEKESMNNVAPLIVESQPHSRQWWQIPWWNKLYSGIEQLGQVAVAACVALTIIIIAQHYYSHSGNPAGLETPAFNTLPIMGQANPVSLGVPSAGVSDSSQQKIQEQQRRVNALLQDYELQRRLYSEQLHFEQPGATRSISSASENQPAGTQTQ